MRRLILDKVASVTLNGRIGHDVRIGRDLPCHEGDIVAVRVLSEKTTYSRMELDSGRFSDLQPGDVIAGCLGHRRALRGYAGRLPSSLEPGDPIHILNLGGVLGECEAWSPDVGPPRECEVLGQVLHFPYLGQRRGIPANIAHGQGPLDEVVATQGVPVVAVAGSAMSAGKTFACTALIQALARRRLVVHAAKATGVSLRRDVHAMSDAGARDVAIFTDLGVVTTTPANAPGLARTLLNRLAKPQPDVIVCELGDGLLGPYGVDAILSSPDLRSAFGAVVLAANDPVAAWGGVRRLKEEHGIAATVVTGPATDNEAGTSVITSLCDVPSANARTDRNRLADIVMGALGIDQPRAPQGLHEEEDEAW